MVGFVKPTDLHEQPVCRKGVPWGGLDPGHAKRRAAHGYRTRGPRRGKPPRGTVSPGGPALAHRVATPIDAAARVTDSIAPTLLRSGPRGVLRNHPVLVTAQYIMPTEVGTVGRVLVMIALRCARHGRCTMGGRYQSKELP
jgi:hypothetical protein